MQRHRTFIPSQPSSGRRSARLPLHLLVLLAGVSGVSTDAQAAWDLFGEVHFTGGRSGNPRLLDEEQPASVRRGQLEGTALLTLGARSSWERNDLDLSYSPYGELFEDGALNQMSHAAGMSWEHRYTPRLSQRLKETFIYNPSRPIQAGGAAVDGALLAGTGVVAHDFSHVLTLQANERNSLLWTFRDTRRIYTGDQLMDSSGSALGMEYARTLRPRTTVSTGYEFGLNSFGDGVPPPAPAAPAGTKPSPPVVRAPAFSEGRDSTRHRAYAGYAYDIQPGLHFDFDGGYDLLVFHKNSLGSFSKPFVRSSLGWKSTRFHASVGYEQGLEDGGGILANAELSRARSDAHIPFSDHASIDVSVSRDVRRGLDDNGNLEGTTLTTWRGGGTFTYTLPLGWSLIAMLTRDRQTATGTPGFPADIEATRYAVGASWTFKP
jgi:hypothetical protein